MKTKSEIINHITTTQIVEKLANRFSSVLNDCKEDFIQYIYLQILELEEEKLQHLSKNNELGYYIIAIARNNALGMNSKFWRTHVDSNLEYINLVEQYEDTEGIFK